MDIQTGYVHTKKSSSALRTNVDEPPTPREKSQREKARYYVIAFDI